MEPPQDSAYQFDRPSNQSGLGIASFAISMILFGFIILIFVVIFGFPAVFPESDEILAVYGATVCGIPILVILGSVVGLALGIAGVAQKGRSKTFSILGIVFNSFILIGFGCMAVFGVGIFANIPMY